MKANELRIGNIIKYIDKPIICDINTIYAVSKCVEPTILYSPIPITDEWLLKLCFENTDKLGLFWDLKMPNFDSILQVWCVNKKISSILQVWCVNKKISICRNGIAAYHSDCNYVHQLQNLYFALTGKELKINF